MGYTRCCQCVTACDTAGSQHMQKYQEHARQYPLSFHTYIRYPCDALCLRAMVIRALVDNVQVRPTVDGTAQGTTLASTMQPLPYTPCLCSLALLLVCDIIYVHRTTILLSRTSSTPLLCNPGCLAFPVFRLPLLIHLYSRGFS
jgi:hypothetical protein